MKNPVHWGMASTLSHTHGRYVLRPFIRSPLSYFRAFPSFLIRSLSSVRAFLIVPHWVSNPEPPSHHAPVTIWS